MDALDKKILDLLAKNSRKSFRRLAKILDVSTDTVSERYNKMVNSGKIKACVATNLYKLGYRVLAWYWLSFSSGSSSSSLRNYLMNIPDVISVQKTIGAKYDLLLVVAIRNFEHLHRIDKIISSVEEITIINSAQYSLKDKQAYFPFPPSVIFKKNGTE